jgi:Tfp pilus assembly protein PilF
MTFVAIAVCWASPTLGDEAASGTKYDKVRDGRRLIKAVRSSIRAGQYDSVMIGLDSVLAGDSSNAAAWYYRGLLQTKTGDTTLACESLRQGASRAPLSTRIKLLLARLDLIGGDPVEAEAILNQVLAIKPNEAEALYLKALLQLQRSDTTAALESFEHALKTVYKSEGNE